MNSVTTPPLAIYPDLQSLCRAGADKFVNLANAALAAHGRFSVALSGGTTPRELYAQLASDEFRGQVDWPRVHFFWGDERAVLPDSPQSNFRMANEALLSHISVPPENIHRWPAEEEPQVAAADYERTLREFFVGAFPRFDLVLLGLGTNGHTASLFPYTSALSESTRLGVAVWVPELSATRLTLTARVLNHAAQIIFLVSGSDKAAVLSQVLRGPHDPDRLPAEMIHPDSGELLWMVDQAAASELKHGL